MSRNIFTPVNQVRLTNVVVVRLKKGGKRLEVACFKNKIMDWRKGIEKDIDEVLQTHRVFINVSKGEIARKEDWEKMFPGLDEAAVVREIMDKGEIQVSDKEREQQQEQMFKDIATTVAEKTTNPELNRPYPVGVIERSMREMHFSVNPAKSTKQQALEAIRLLMKRIPLARALMRLRLHLVPASVDSIKPKILALDVHIEREEHKDKVEIDCLSEPGCFREVEDMVRAAGGVVEIMDLAVTETGEMKIDNVTLQHTVAKEAESVDQSAACSSSSAKSKKEKALSDSEDDADVKKKVGKKKGGNAFASLSLDSDGEINAASEDDEDDWGSSKKGGKKKKSGAVQPPAAAAVPEGKKKGGKAAAAIAEEEEEEVVSSKKGKKAGKQAKQAAVAVPEPVQEDSEEEGKGKRKGKKKVSAAPAASQKPADNESDEDVVSNRKKGKGKGKAAVEVQQQDEGENWDEEDGEEVQ